MRILIMGAGLAGVTAAFELLEDGHDITVIDRQPGPALETSFANAGLVAPGHAFAWGSPRAPKILLKSLVKKGQPLRYRLRLDPAMWRWSLKFLRECTAEKARINTERKHRLCRYAQLALQDVVKRTGVAYDGEQKGLLYLYRQAESFERGAKNMQIMLDAGHKLEEIDRERAAEIDPALEPAKDRIAGGFYAPTDESGDAQKFTSALAALLEERGVRFRYGTTVTGIKTEGESIDEVLTDKGAIKADLYIMALGAFSPLIAKDLGETVSVYPVKGYSATLPVNGVNNPPTVGGIDEDNLFAYVRMGDRVRLTAVAEFAGYDTSHRPSDFSSMLKAAKELLPNAGDYGRPSYWACLRPMTPEGTPILGKGKFDNLYYNTGHGHMGWTMACGTARITADLIAGRNPDLPLEGLTLR
ncbi:MAG: D-amino acid dehydrogenase [Alphaproteobacteria bacterium]